MSDTSANPETGEILTEEEAVEYAKIDRVLKKYTPRRNELNAKIKRIFTSKGKRLIGPVIIDVTERTSKDTKAAEAKYPRAKFPHLWEDVPVFQFDRLTERQQKPFLGTTLALSVDVLAEDSPSED